MDTYKISELEKRFLLPDLHKNRKRPDWKRALRNRTNKRRARNKAARKSRQINNKK
jgi:hypothetical protein